MAAFYTSFARLLYSKLIQHEQHSLKQVAFDMGMKLKSLYGYAEGRAHFPIDLVPLLIRATRDPEFLDFICQGTDFMVVPRPCGNSTGLGLEREAMDITVENGELHRHIRDGLADGVIDDIERKKLIRICLKAQRELQDVINELEHPEVIASTGTGH